MHFDSGIIALCLAIASAIYYAGRTTKAVEALAVSHEKLEARVKTLEEREPERVFVKGAASI